MKALMKNLITISILLCCTIALPSCQNDDWKKEVEKLRNELDIQKQLFDASQNNIYITDVTTANDGYTITLSDGNTIVLQNGIDGTNGNQITNISANGDQMTFSFSDGTQITLAINKSDVNEICLPSYLYMLSDTRNDIFIEPFIKRWYPFDYNVRFNGDFYSRRLERVVSVDKPENDKKIIANLYELKNFTRISIYSSRIRLGIKNTGNSEVVAQIIGDSYTQGAFYKDALLRKGYVPNLKLVGLRDVKVESEDDPLYTTGQYDEGRNGACMSWYFEVFTGNNRYHGFMHPDGDFRYWGSTEFWQLCFLVEKGERSDLEVTNGKYGSCLHKFKEDGYLKSPVKGDLQYDSTQKSFVMYDGSQWINVRKEDFTWNFDYGKYLAMWNITPPHFLAEMLGLNDFRNNINADFSTFDKQLRIVKESYLKAVPNGKFLILIPCSTCGTMDNKDGNFTIMQNFAMWRFRKYLIDNFDKKESEGYYLVDIGITIDNEDGYYYDEEGMQLYQPHPYKNYPTMGIPLAAFIQYHR